jgi:predicted RNA-binding protein with EMAP domain
MAGCYKTPKRTANIPKNRCQRAIMSDEADLQELLDLLDKQKALLKRKGSAAEWAAEYAERADEIRRLIDRLTENRQQS